MVFLKEFFKKKLILKKSADDNKKHDQLSSRQRDTMVMVCTADSIFGVLFIFSIKSVWEILSDNLFRHISLKTLDKFYLKSESINRDYVSYMYSYLPTHRKDSL